MPNQRLKGLPLEALYVILLTAVKELLDAINYEEDKASIKSKRKQCEMIYDAVILAKQKEESSA